jgi:hypothetical protein
MAYDTGNVVVALNYIPLQEVETLFNYNPETSFIKVTIELNLTFIHLNELIYSFSLFNSCLYSHENSSFTSGKEMVCVRTLIYMRGFSLIFCGQV